MVHAQTGEADGVIWASKGISHTTTERQRDRGRDRHTDKQAQTETHESPDLRSHV